MGQLALRPGDRFSGGRCLACLLLVGMACERMGRYMAGRRAVRIRIPWIFAQEQRLGRGQLLGEPGREAGIIFKVGIKRAFCLLCTVGFIAAGLSRAGLPTRMPPGSFGRPRHRGGEGLICSMTSRGYRRPRHSRGEGGRVSYLTPVGKASDLWQGRALPSGAEFASPGYRQLALPCCGREGFVWLWCRSVIGGSDRIQGKVHGKRLFCWLNNWQFCTKQGYGRTARFSIKFRFPCKFTTFPYFINAEIIQKNQHINFFCPQP